MCGNSVIAYHQHSSVASAKPAPKHSSGPLHVGPLYRQLGYPYIWSLDHMYWFSPVETASEEVCRAWRCESMSPVAVI